jgi:hypothetical protein
MVVVVVVTVTMSVIVIEAMVVALGVGVVGHARRPVDWTIVEAAVTVASRGRMASRRPYRPISAFIRR